MNGLHCKVEDFPVAADFGGEPGANDEQAASAPRFEKVEKSEKVYRRENLCGAATL